MNGVQLNYTGLDLSDSTIPVNVYYFRGTKIPLDGMLGVFLFEDGEVDTWHNGEFANLVPGSMPGRVYPGWSAPQMKNFGTRRGGFRVTDVNGALIDTRISAQRPQFTAAYIVRTHAKRSSVHPYNLIHLLTNDPANGLPPDNSGQINLINSNSIWGIGATLNDTKTGQFIRFGAPISNAGVNFVEMAASLGVQDAWNAFAISVDGPSGAIRFQTLLDYRTVTDADLGRTLIYDTWVTNLALRTGNFLLGATPNGPGRDSAGPLADIHCAAFSGFAESGSGINSILRGLARRAADSGLTVAGY